MSQGDIYLTDAFKNAQNKIAQTVNQYSGPLNGLDSCVENGKYANQFKIDRRCYMTDEQRQKHPYNAVVGITVNGNNGSHYEALVNSGGCTGVIIKNPYDGQLYIYTAAHCVSTIKAPVGSGFEQYAYTQNGYAFPITNIVKHGGGYGNGNYEYLTKDRAIFAIPQKYQHVLPYAETGEYTDNRVDIVGHGFLSILNDSAIHAAKQEWEKILKKSSKAEKSILEQIGEYSDAFPKDYRLKVSFSCELLKDDELNQSNAKKHNYCQTYGGNSGGPVFNLAGQVIGVVSNGYANILDDNLYAFFPYEGMKDIADYNKDLQKYQEMSTKEPQNINNLKHIDSFNPHKKAEQ